MSQGVNDGVQPALDVHVPAGDVRGVALVLHGGREHSHARARARQLAVLRMVPFVTALRESAGDRSGPGGGLVVARLVHRYRGWNDDERSPVPDATWALDRLAERFGGVPAALVGHSMGGRTAVYAAGHPTVTTVVGLAPWIEPGDAVTPMTGRHLLVLHGTRDRTTSPVQAARYTAQAAAIARSAAFVDVRGETHPMLRRAAVWHRLSTAFVVSALLGVPPEESADANSAKIVVKALAGGTDLHV